MLYVAFCFETSMQVTVTDYAMKRSGKLHGMAQAFPINMDFFD